MNKFTKYLSIAFVTAILSTIIIPIIINESYKSNTGYITIWGAPEMLSYFGTVFGGIVTATTFLFTIIFTINQSQRENYLRQELEKWNKIDETISKIIEEIDPIALYKKIMIIDQLDTHKK